MSFCSACTRDVAAAKKNTKSNGWVEVYREQSKADPKGPKYLYGTKYGFCSSNFPYGLSKYAHMGT